MRSAENASAAPVSASSWAAPLDSGKNHHDTASVRLVTKGLRVSHSFNVALLVASTTAPAAVPNGNVVTWSAVSIVQDRQIGWLDGTVVFPADTPPDEQVEVVLSALPVEKLGSFPFEDEDVAFLAPIFHEGWLEIDRTTPAVDGSFHLLLPPERSALRIHLHSTYLYLRDLDPWIYVEDPTARVVLEPKVGGALRFCLIPPHGTRLDVGALAGQTITLEWLPLHRSFKGTPPERLLSVSLAHELSAGGLSPECGYRLEGQPLPFAAIAMRNEVRVSPGIVTEIDIDLVEGLPVAGRLVDESGAPISGAELVAVCWLDRMGFGSRTTTMHDGSFRFDPVHPSLHHISISCAGFRGILVDRTSLGADEQLASIELVLPRMLPR